MPARFPLVRRPGRILFLSNDTAYIATLSLVLPAHWRIRPFADTQNCLDHIWSECPRWEADAWNQQRIVNRWREGCELIPQILSYWTENPGRRDLSHVVVIDQGTPGVTGLKIFDELVDWPGARVLLSGHSQEPLAVEAFNRGLIDQFLPRQSFDLRLRLAESIGRYLETPNARHAHIWRDTLSPEQAARLRNPSISRDLARLCEQQAWVEHVVIGNPFGMLATDAAGAVSWLQLACPDDPMQRARSAPASSRDRVFTLGEPGLLTGTLMSPEDRQGGSH